MTGIIIFQIIVILILRSFCYPSGDFDDSFALQIYENTTMWCENTNRRLQIKQKTKEFKGCNIAILLDLDESTMCIYLNGKLQTDQSRPKGPSFIGVKGVFRPALCLFGSSVQMSILSGLEVPTKPPGIAVINLEDCSVDNTKISLAWTPPENCNVDCYILQADILNREGDIHQERNFAKVRTCAKLMKMTVAFLLKMTLLS